jgi:hypothetical protein
LTPWKVLGDRAFQHECTSHFSGYSYIRVTFADGRAIFLKTGLLKQ